MDEVEEYMVKEIVEEAAAHIKMGLKYHISTITLKMHSGPHYQMIQEKGYQWTQYALSY